MRQQLLITVLLSLFFISCAGPKVAIQYQGSSPVPRVASEALSEENRNDSQSDQPSSTVILSFLPSLEGGDRALRKRIAYPDEAIQHSAEGTVSIQFIIDENGNTSDFTIVEGIGYGCEEAVIDAIQKSQFTTDHKNQDESLRYLWMVTAEFRL